MVGSSAKQSSILLVNRFRCLTGLRHLLQFLERAMSFDPGDNSAPASTRTGFTISSRICPRITTGRFRAPKLHCFLRSASSSLCSLFGGSIGEMLRSVQGRSSSALRHYRRSLPRDTLFGHTAGIKRACNRGKWWSTVHLSMKIQTSRGPRGSFITSFWDPGTSEFVRPRTSESLLIPELPDLGELVPC